MAFRHALWRDAFYSDIPWTTRIKLHRAVAQRLDTDRGAATVVAEHWALGRQTDRAREALLSAAEAFARCTLTATVNASSGAHCYCGPKVRTRRHAWTGPSAAPGALS